jgi:hypothetical protein
MTTNLSGKDFTRASLAAVTLSISVAAIAITVIIISTIAVKTGIPDLPFNDLAKKAIDSRLDLSRTLLQVSLLMTGALWGLVIAKKDEVHIVLSDKIEISMFIEATVLLLLSVGAYAVYVNKITNYLSDAAVSTGPSNSSAAVVLSMPNVFDQNINYLFVCQTVTLVAGLFNGVVTLVSAHNLKGG